MNQILSDDLWPTVRHLATPESRVRAAMAFFAKDHIRFKQGDVLVCDASERAVSTGQTSARLLRESFDRGAALYSLTGLHAKALLIDRVTVIGSGNMSGSSEKALFEAALLTANRQVFAQTLALINKFIEGADVIDRSFLSRIAAIPVVRSGSPVTRKPAQPDVVVGKPRAWLVSLKPLSDRMQEKERIPIAAGLEKAKEFQTDPDNELGWIRMKGRNRFRSHVKMGDTVVKAWIEQKGSRTMARSSSVNAVVHREEGDDCTYIYLESDGCADTAWGKVKKHFKARELAEPKASSTRELSELEVQAFSCLADM